MRSRGAPSEAGADPVAAAAIKIANNFVLGCAIEAMGEGFSLIRKYDVVPDVFYDVMTDGCSPVRPTRSTASSLPNSATFRPVSAPSWD